MGSPCKEYISSWLQKFPTSTFVPLFKTFWPLFLSLVSRRFIGTINVAFAGRAVSTVAMGAVGISFSLLTVTATGLGSGLAVSFETMAGKAYGSKNLKIVGILLQKAFLFAGFLSILVASVWIHMAAILKHLGISDDVADDVEMYLIIYIPTMIAILIFRLLRAYLIIQKVIIPSFIVTVIGVLVLFPFNYFFIYVVKLKTGGIAVANDLSYSLCVVLILIYIIVTGGAKNDLWQGFTTKCFLDWGNYLILALPAAFNFLLKSSIHEFALIAIGTIGTVQVAAQTALFTLIKAMLTLAFAVGQPMNINIAKSFGQKDPAEAKRVTLVGNLFNLLISATVALILVALRDYIGVIFTRNVEVQQLIAQVTPYASLSFVWESVTTIFFFLCMPLQLQLHSTIIYIISSYLFGLPLGIVLAIRHRDISLVWCGLSAGFFVQFLMFLVLFYWKADYEAMCGDAQESTPLRKNGKKTPKYSPDSNEKKSRKSEMEELDSWLSPKDIEKEAEKSLLEKDDETDDEEKVTKTLVGKRCLILSTAVFILAFSIIIRVGMHV